MQYDLEHERLLASTKSKQAVQHDLLTSDEEGLSLKEEATREYSPLSIPHHRDAKKLGGIPLKYRHSPLLWRLTVMVGDSIIFGSLLLLMLLVLHFHPTLLTLQDKAVWHPKVVVGCLALLLWSVATRITQAYEFNNLYDRLASPFCAFLSFGLMLIFLLVLGYPFVTNGDVYLEILLFYLLAAVPVLCAWRVIIASVMNFPRFRSRAVIVGVDAPGKNVARELQKAKRYTANVLGYISVRPTETEEGYEDGLPILGDQRILRHLVQQGQVDTIIMAIDYRANPSLFQEAIELAQFGVSVVPMMTAYERTSGKIPVEHVGDQWHVAFPSEVSISPLYLVWRKTLDIIFAVLGMLVLLLLFPVLAPCIYLDSPGPIFYQQERMGRNGRKFIIYKFRSMHTDSEFTGRAQWASEGDTRITRIGRFMRATHMDESPQVWNILRGEMSLIGPRPERQEFVATLEKSIPFYRCRMSVKPGLTGWAQVKYGYGNSNQDALEKLQYDLYYIKHQSFMLDIFIILRTIVEVFLRRGT